MAKKDRVVAVDEMFTRGIGDPKNAMTEMLGEGVRIEDNNIVDESELQADPNNRVFDPNGDLNEMMSIQKMEAPVKKPRPRSKEEELAMLISEQAMDDASP